QSRKVMVSAAKRHRSAGLALVLATACGGASRSGDLFGSGAVEGGSASASAGDESGSIATSEGDAHGTDGGLDDAGSGSPDTADGGDDLILDVGGPSSADGGGEGGGGEGCDAVDLLFVIDNSGSMQPYQDALAQTFPLFVDAIVANLPVGTDLHVGITNTSFGSPQAGGIGSSGCSNAALNDEALASHYPPPSQPNGQNGGQGRLFEWDGQTFFAANTADDPAPLSAWFTAAATAIGEQGSNWEMVAAGAGFVAHPDNAAANAGFLRDEGAVLVVFVLTDEVDNSPESAAVYHDLLVAAKSGCGGDLCIVPAGLVPPCVQVTEDNVLFELLHSFDQDPVLGDIGTPESTEHYPDILGDALAQVIAQTCDEIRPEG
ncbi:MAG TPA: hypothetical protein VFG69_01790, partial [Nannocystaceae bacterium]|nr:hypothetical protein [Nannocystaceae bacterium]